MNTLIVFTLLVAGTHAWLQYNSLAPASIAAAPIAISAPAPYETPLHTVYDSSLNANEVLDATGQAYLLPGIPFHNSGGIHAVASEHLHHYAAPSYGLAV